VPALLANTITPRRAIKNYQLNSLINLRYVALALSRGAACVWPRWCPVYRWRELVAGAGTEQENLSSR